MSQVSVLNQSHAKAILIARWSPAFPALVLNSHWFTVFLFYITSDWLLRKVLVIHELSCHNRILVPSPYNLLKVIKDWVSANEAKKFVLPLIRCALVKSFSGATEDQSVTATKNY